MNQNNQSKLRIMTLNLGGGIKNFSGPIDCMSPEKREAMLKLITDVQADILCVQEVAQYIDADGILHSMVDHIRSAGNYSHFFYGETLSMKKHMQVKKDVMVNGLFKDWWDWSKGNALFSRMPFARLGDSTKEGVPRNVPIFQPLTYEGSRDTDPRYVILSRIKQYPYPYIVNLHLTTLVGERGSSAWSSDIVDAARLTRSQQLSRIFNLVDENIIQKSEPLILMGDFNATPEEYTIKDYLEKEKAVVRLVPKNPVPTHQVAGMVDHIFFAPASRLVHYECWIDDRPLSREVSDHLPVISDIVIQ